MLKNKLHNFLGLAKKAGKLVAGTGAVENSIRQKTSRLVVMACDVSENTKKRLTDKCNYYNIELITFGNKESIGKAIGEELAAAVSINDNNFASAINGIYNEFSGGEV